MAIGMVEMQGMINRTQDFQQLQHYDNEKGAIYQNNQQLQVDRNVEESMTQVHKKDDADAESGDNERGGGEYGGDGGRHRKKKLPEARIVQKSTMAFDIKI